MAIGRCNVINIQSKPCNITPVGNNWKHTVINERIVLPDSMPNINSVQGVTATLKINSTNFIITPDSGTTENSEGTLVTGLKLLVNGQIEENITYDSGISCKLYSLKHTEYFTTYIVLDSGYDITKAICLSSCIEGIMVEQVDCRQILKNVAVFVTVK